MAAKSFVSSVDTVATGEGGDAGHVSGRLQAHQPKKCRSIGDWQRDHGFATAAVGPVGKLQHASVGLGDLAAQNQPNAAAAVLGSKEGDKEVVAVQQAGTVVAD